MKKSFTKALLTAMTIALTSAAAVAVNPETSSAKVKVKKLTAQTDAGKTVQIAKGKKVKITTTVTVTPNKKANKAVTYKSGNSSIATVSSKGVIKGASVGKTSIVVTSKKDAKKKATIQVVIKKTAVKKVALNTKNFSLAVGGKKTIKASVTPKKEASSKIAYTSSNKKVATVTSKGVVKGVGEGTATITAKATDGSNKKASVKVTVGAGIASISILDRDVIRVTLTGKKALVAGDFAVQNKDSRTGKYVGNQNVVSVSSNDNKTYDVNIRDSIYEHSYLKVTISKLKVDKSKEVYVGAIPGHADSTKNKISYETAIVGEVYSKYWGISNSMSDGRMTYSVSNLPAGLKAYVDKSGRNVRVYGKPTAVAKGVTAVLTGVDEAGQTFTEKRIFYIGNKTQIVAGAKPSTMLSYTLDNPNTAYNESVGSPIDDSDVTSLLTIAGGSGSYNKTVTYGGKAVSDTFDSSKAMPAGNYKFDVQITDSDDSNIKTSISVTINVVTGTTVKGSVKDASGKPAKYVSVGGYSKTNAYDDDYTFSARTDINGNYVTRVVPGNYKTYVYGPSDNYYRTYDSSVGNNFASGTVTKNFKLPLYRISFTAGINGVAGYSYGTVRIMNQYGDMFLVESCSNNYDPDHGLFAYVTPGTYSICPYNDDNTYTNVVSAYGKVEPSVDATTKLTHYYLSSFLGSYRLSGGNFTVNGPTTVKLTATKMATDD